MYATRNTFPVKVAYKVLMHVFTRFTCEKMDSKVPEFVNVNKIQVD